MTNMRSGLRSLALAGLVLTVSVAPSLAADKTIKVVPRGDLNILDPIWSTVAVTRNYGFMVYDMLYALDAKFQAQPQMLEKSELSADGLTYTMTLRPGLKWHDGAPVTAAGKVRRKIAAAFGPAPLVCRSKGPGGAAAQAGG